MDSSASNTVGSREVQADFQTIKTPSTNSSNKSDLQDIFEKVSDDILGHKLFPFVATWEVLQGAAKVLCPAWKKIVETEKAARLREYCFGKEKWKKYFGLEVEGIQLPANMWNIIHGPCPYNRGKIVKDTHIPPVLFPAGLSLNTLGKLVEAPLKGNKTAYSYVEELIKTQYGDKTFNESYWASMTDDVIRNTRNKSWSEQEKQVKEHRNYVIPKALEATICILTHFVASEIHCYGLKPLTYTRCREKVQGYRIIVGGFGPAGLSVNDDVFVDDDDLGVGALRKF